MAQPITQTNIKTPSHAHTSMRADIAERRIRQVSAWFLLYLVAQAELGLAWDRQWHDLVGRDQFWIPPHIMLYSGIGGAGLVTLFVVLADTIRFYRGAPGVDDSSTISIFRLFHAPFGFVLLGFGALIDLLAAPFDNYWHQLYGIDVTLWSPFHIMGTLGGIVAGLGLIYAFASEAAIERQAEYPSRLFLGLNGPEWGTLAVFAAFIELTLPILTAFLPVTLGTPFGGQVTFQLATYPFPLVSDAAGFLIAATQLTRRPGSAILTTLLLWLIALVTQSFVPWALREVVPRYGLTFRFSGRQPTFNITLVLLPLFFLICALLIDSVAYWRRRHHRTSGNSLRGIWLLGALAALPAVFIPPAIVQTLLHLTPSIPLPPDILHVLVLSWPEVLPTLVSTMILGALTATIGWGLGDIWHLSKN